MHITKIIPLKIRVGFYLIGRAVSFLGQNWKTTLTLCGISVLVAICFQALNNRLAEMYMFNSPNFSWLFVYGTLQALFTILIAVLIMILMHRKFIKESFVGSEAGGANYTAHFGLYFLVYYALSMISYFTNSAYYISKQLSTFHLDGNGVNAIGLRFWIRQLEVFVGSFLWSFVLLAMAIFLCGFAIKKTASFKDGSILVRKHFSLIVVIAFAYGLLFALLQIFMDQLQIWIMMSEFYFIWNVISVTIMCLITLILTVLMSDLYLISHEGKVRGIKMFGDNAWTFLKSITSGRQES